MTHKQQAIVLSKPWLETSSFSARSRKIAAKLINLVVIPVGYEDNTGFHYGNEPALNNVQRPTS